MGEAFAVTIHTHQERGQVLTSTLQHLKNQGFPKVVVSVQDAPPDPARNRLNARDALNAAMPWPSGGVLMLEDDVRWDNDWRDWLTAAQRLNKPVWFYSAYAKNYPGWFWSAHTQHPDGMPKFARGLYPMSHAPQLWGAQAVWFPTSVLSLMWRDARLHTLVMDGNPIDGFFRQWFTTAPKHMQPWIAIPNPVEHTAPPSVVNKARPQHTSISRAYASHAWGKGVTLYGIDVHSS